MLLSAPPVLLSSAPNSGFPAFTTICCKGVSFPLGMAIDLISLLWAILRSSRLHWPLLRLHYGQRTKRGKLVPLRRHLCWTSLRLVLLQSIFLLALPLVRVCARFGRCPRFCLLLSLRTALLLALLPRVRWSVHCARDLAHPAVRRGPWSFCDRGEMAHPW